MILMMVGDSESFNLLVGAFCPIALVYPDCLVLRTFFQPCKLIILLLILEVKCQQGVPCSRMLFISTYLGVTTEVIESFPKQPFPNNPFEPQKKLPDAQPRCGISLHPLRSLRAHRDCFGQLEFRGAGEQDLWHSGF